MATQEEAQRIDDVLRMEAGMFYSREKRTVSSGQSILIGQVCQGTVAATVLLAAGTGAVNAVDEVQTVTIVEDADVPEVQTLAITGTPTGGTFALGYQGAWTTALAYGASDGDIETALEALATIAGVAVSSKVITWDAAGPRDMIDLDIDMLTGGTPAGSIVRTTPGTAGLSAGSFKLGIVDLNGDMQWTGDIAYDANAAAINTALDAVLGATLVVAAGGGAPLVFTLTFSGAGYTELPQPLVLIDISELVGADSVDVTETVAGAVAIGIIGPGLAANCISLEDVDASSGALEGMFLVRHGVVAKAGLVYGANVTTTPQKAAVDVVLAAAGMVVRDGPTYTTL